jgi:hypothetical protein
MATREPVYRHLTDDNLPGDGSNYSMNVNGSVTPQRFYIQPAPGTGFLAIFRLIVTIEDNANITADGYGGLNTLTNGIDIAVKSGGPTGTVELDLLDGDPVKNIIAWGEHSFDVSEHTFGSGNNFVLARWTFSKAGRPLVLDANHNEALVATINDDMTGLVKHQFHVQGHAFRHIGDHLVTWGD